MRAEIISVGTELTTGQSVDTNSAWLSQQLAAVGIEVVRHTTVADDLKILRRSLLSACEGSEVVLISGGIGPTEDDVTRDALATAMGVELELHAPSLERIRAFFTQRRRAMPKRNQVQAMFPVGSRPIENTCGTAPGVRARIGAADVFVMPGVPHEMKVMFERDVLPRLAGEAGRAILTRCVWCYGAGESDIGERLGELMTAGRNPLVGTTAQETVIGVRIVAAGASSEAARQMLDETAGHIRERLGDLVFGEDDDTLADAVAALLTRANKTVATAESCTGGLVAKRLTDVPGSSAWFLDGVVTYTNEAKVRLLGVPADTIERHGAVSARTAEAMAVSCREKSGTDYAIAITGIAGPTGGSADKSVGLVFIALADADGCAVKEMHFGEQLTRAQVRDRSAKTALNLLRLALLRGGTG